MSATNYEIALLSGLLARPEFASAVVLSENDFSTPTASAIFTVIKASVSPTPVTVSEELARRGVVNPALLSKLFAVKPDSIDQEELEGYAEEVRKDAVRRRLHQRVNRASDLLREGKLEDATGLLSQSLLQVTEEMVVGADPTAQGIIERMARVDGGVEYFPLGLTFIDAATGGGRHGHIIVIAGPYKARKTNLALHICKTVLEQGRSVAYFALEDDDASFVQRLMAVATDCPPNWFDVPPGNRTPAMQAKVDSALAWMADKNFRVYDAKHGVHRLQNIEALFRSDKLKFGTDLCVVDYVQALGEDWERLTEASQRLQRLAQENQICVVELSQFSGETLKEGSKKGYLATKGSQAFGAACHQGFELRYDPTRKGRSQAIDPNDHKTLGSISEIGVHMKVARQAPPQWQYLIINPVTGFVTEQLPYPSFPSRPGAVD